MISIGPDLVLYILMPCRTKTLISERCMINFSTFSTSFNCLNNLQTCQCKEFKFYCEPHGHVITGDRRVIDNAKLRELVAKGSKYREPNRVNWKATETMFLESTDLCAKSGPKENKWNSNISLNGTTS